MILRKNNEHADKETCGYLSYKYAAFSGSVFGFSADYYAVSSNVSYYKGADGNCANGNSYTAANRLAADNCRAANTAGNLCPAHAGT